MADIKLDPQGKPACSNQSRMAWAMVWAGISAFIWGAYLINTAIMMQGIAMTTLGKGIYAVRRGHHTSELTKQNGMYHNEGKASQKPQN